MKSLLAEKLVGESCIICGDLKQKGIHLYTAFICTECEQEIIQTDTSDPKYNFYIDKLKKVNTPEIFS